MILVFSFVFNLAMHESIALLQIWSEPYLDTSFVLIESRKSCLLRPDTESEAGFVLKYFRASKLLLGDLALASGFLSLDYIY